MPSGLKATAVASRFPDSVKTGCVPRAGSKSLRPSSSATASRPRLLYAVARTAPRPWTTRGIAWLSTSAPTASAVGASRYACTINWRARSGWASLMDEASATSCRDCATSVWARAAFRWV
ncbi:hypothetical protein K7395_06335 [Streptomyces filamentosus]|uniref:Uncharacterized protein n=1 Tax=Streptomyces filamentosus TaxID=67294 RepID=A0ABY4UQ48_STRFL|nr:hypothetical protein [Streptomyces filamentosus]USC46381.1 hypothetical protein K7395_06335 [Streptomyces filamentosus]